VEGRKTWKVASKHNTGWRRWLWRLGLGGLVLAVLSLLALGVTLWLFARTLPPFDSLADYHPPQVSRCYDVQGRVAAEFFEQRRTVIALPDIPLQVRQAFLAAEDADFYRHPGLDFTGMLRALWRNILAGKVVQGGSTITQQVVKTFLLGPERSLRRKIREALLALRIESNLSKDDILSLYLNQIYFGHGCYGVQEAARFFFGRPVSRLTLAQAAMLASLPKSPSLYSPLRHPAAARRRRNWVLSRMADNGFVSSAAAARASGEEIKVVGQAVDNARLAPWYTEYCRRLLEAQLGHELLYRGGLRIELALDLDVQRFAQLAVADGLRRIDRRYGFRGPLGHLGKERWRELKKSWPSSRQDAERLVWNLIPAGKEGRITANWQVARTGDLLVVPVLAVAGEDRPAAVQVDLGRRTGTIPLDRARWILGRRRGKQAGRQLSRLLKTGDLVEVKIDDGDGEALTLSLQQPPRVQAALVAIEPGSRQVRALVGGSDFRVSSFIRAVQAQRQPGSAFKPVVYATAISKRTYTPASILIDSPEVYRLAVRGSDWKPQNFEREFHGEVSLRTALAHSINTVAVKVVADVGADAVVEMARRLGITSPLRANLSLALGSSEVNLLELTNAYAVFPAAGEYRPPRFILAVKGADGQPLESAGREETSASRQALTAAEAFIMVSLLRSVIEEGTGRKARRLGRPLAGKTGTTNGQRDGWFVGFSPQLAAGVWVGFDNHRRMGGAWAQGAGTALPIWMEFMGAAERDKPVSDFVAPPEVVFVRIDPRNGLLARADQLHCPREVFLAGTEPREKSAAAGDCSAEGQGGASGPAAGNKLPEGLFR